MTDTQKITERYIQTVMMGYVMYKKHHAAVPNNTTMFHWEADLISLAKSNFSHEYEIKLNIKDYKADFKKLWKHQNLSQRLRPAYLPNYFWYVTYDFDIDPPEYAGWISITTDDKKPYVRRQAPRLHNQKASQKQKDSMMISLSHQLRQEYEGASRNLELKGL